MRIQIDFQAMDPPYGLIEREGNGPAIHFEGWLGLVTSLEALLETARGTVRATEDGRQG